MIDAGLSEALTRAGRSPRLLIGCDYDGTLAPIVDDPSRAHPLRDAIVGLRGLANLADTHVAVISGRSLRDLAVLSRLPDEIHLVGSHGSEFEPDLTGRLTDQQAQLRDEIVADLQERAMRVEGSSIEIKPSGVTFHYRRADEYLGPREAQAIRDRWSGNDEVIVRDGKCVVELSVIKTDKGTALERIRRSVGADTVVFVGDDITDEDAFAVLKGPDIGIKVGGGESRASYRVEDTTEVTQVIARLKEEREAWVYGHRAVPIARHSLLSDQRTMALIDDAGRVSWMCHPRADGAAIFAEIVGGPSAGVFAIEPLDDSGTPAQQYLADSMIVQTQWPTVTVTDYLDVWDERAQQPASRSNLIRAIEGSGRVRITFAPRPDFGRLITELQVNGHGVAVIGDTHPVRLRSPHLDWALVDDGEHQRAEAIVDLSAGSLVLDLVVGWDVDDDGVDETQRRQRTSDFWTSISGQIARTRHAHSAVRRSALILEALRYVPTGSMLAAATTSLPEHLGGVRNWDYRFCWPRDASMACTSLARLGRTGPGLEFLDWLGHRIDNATRPDLLRPLYPLDGDESAPEAAVAELAGYRGSRPVRIGNAAEGQVQLDALGPIAELIATLSTAGVPLRDRHYVLLEQLADVVVAYWSKPDHGIWEMRRARRHNVVSKLMCWLVLDRAIAVGLRTNRDIHESWLHARSAIRSDVLDRGWSTATGTFVSAYGTEDLDAGLLLLGTTGFIEPSDTRFVATLHAIERHLTNGVAVYRYRYDDGLPGDEGGMLICTGWLIAALAAVGRIHDAEVWLSRLIAAAGPTGLLAEQINPDTETALGNVPQAYSHLALIDSALALDRANRDMSK